MSWSALDPRIQTIAQEVLTLKQLVAYRLDANGMSQTDIATHLRITRRAVRDRLTDADIKIRAHPDYPKEAA